MALAIESLKKYDNDQLISYIIFNKFTKRELAIIRTIKKGDYITLYKLQKFFPYNTIQRALKKGLNYGLLKRTKNYDGDRLKWEYSYIAPYGLPI